jgi:transcriptional regulator with XRE-family HTH domain
MLHRSAPPTSLSMISERLHLSRKALGFSQAVMSGLLDSPASLWANYEAGIRRISIDKAFQLKAATGLTLDWIFCGDLSALPAPIATKILDQMKLNRAGDQ